MLAGEAIQLRNWRAELALRYERRAARTVMVERRHDGPLVVQKPLYPEGDAVCHTIIVHPPAGIAGGDELDISVQIGDRASALLTTPGAGKWYRSAGAWAGQTIAFDAGPGATIEWLPQESIVYDGALADIRTAVALKGDAAFIGWDLYCLGRTGSGEHFSRGRCRIGTQIRRDGRLLWLERGTIEGGGALLESPAGLGGKPVFGTLLAAAPGVDAALVVACRETSPREGQGAVTLLPGVIAARYLGASSEAGRAWFTGLWRILRPALLRRDAHLPRIWST